jgi:hypothetical protein
MMPDVISITCHLAVGTKPSYCTGMYIRTCTLNRGSLVKKLGIKIEVVKMFNQEREKHLILLLEFFLLLHALTQKMLEIMH